MAGYKIITTNGSLQHHGVKGMKWGVRRYRNPDGTLTEEGKKHYGIEGQELLNRYVKTKNSIKSAKASGRYAYDSTYAMKLEKAKQLAKSDLKNQAIRKKLREGKIKESKRMQKLTQRYMAAGMSEEDAKIKAYRRARVEKALAIGAGITLAAAAGVAAYAIYKDRADTYIKPGQLLSRVTNDNTNNLHPVFYASDDKHKFANKMYTGMYAKQIQGYNYAFGKSNNDVYKKTLEVKDKLKVASNKNASDTLRDLLSKDTQMRTDIAEHLRSIQYRAGGKQRTEVNKALKALDAGKYNRHVYNAFNYEGAKSSDKFISALRKKGYDAINDVNDQKLSGYAAKSARIYINNNKIGVKNIGQLTQDKINADNAIAVGRVTAKAYAKQAGATAGTVAGVKGAISGLDKLNESNVIKNYRKEHPNTKMSDNDILRNYYRIK